MNLKDEVLTIIESSTGHANAAATIIRRGGELLEFVVLIGVDNLAAKNRATKRRSLRVKVKPGFVKAPRAAYGRVTMSKRSKARLVAATEQLFTGWSINATITLGGATKEDLLVQAAAERASAKGHIRNAVFYETLAEPLAPGQRVAEYWKDLKTVTLIRDELWRETEDQEVGLTKAA